MSMLLYKIGMRLYTSAIAVASITHPKAKQWIAGRKNIFEEIRRKINTNEKYIWIHCASAGEFEQGRPLIEALREKYEAYKIILTFFSPSGYELRKNYNGAHLIFYLPADLNDNAKRFIDLVRPKLAIFVKYEFWLGYLNELTKQNIPHVLIAARFDDEQIFFKWYGKIFHDALKGFKMLFVQDEKSCELLKSIGVTNCMVSGDTRYDRVIEIATAAEPVLLMERFVKDNKNISTGSMQVVLIAGSTWAEDEKLLRDWYKQSPNWKLVIVPHEINKEHINNLKKLFGNDAILWSELDDNVSPASGGQKLGNKRVLIVDTIGLLSRLYRYATVCYVGGGFGKGIHNTLEAAVYGKPVAFGPNYKRFREAEALVQTGGGLVVLSANDLLTATKSFANDNTVYRNASDAAQRTVRQGSGATIGIVKKLENIFKTTTDTR